MITYKRTKTGLKIEIKSKLYKSRVNYDNKKTHKQYTGYYIHLPRAVITYLNSKSNQLYFYEQNNNIYLTGHNPGSIVNVYSTTYSNVNKNIIKISIPSKLLKNIYSSVILTINPIKKDFFTNKMGEIKVTFE